MNEHRQESREALSADNAADVATIATKRRFLFLGATATAAAATLAVGSPARAAAAGEADAADIASAPERGGGYHLSEHVKRYYRTAAV